MFYESIPGGSDSKESACDTGDPSSIPGSERFSAEGNGNPLQYSFLENSMDRGTWKSTVHGVSKSQTQLSKEHFHSHIYHALQNNTLCCFYMSFNFA